MNESLWPARNVAEYAYCPRLFYYMEVEGIHVPSSDTVEGVALHRRVDKPSAARAEAPPDADKPASVRSLTLTSRSLGLTATLDLAEIHGEIAVPVEYRKGRPRRVDSHPDDELPTAVEPWPTDRVQVGLQALLLEESGYTVPHAVVYYAAEKRRVTVAIDDALKAEALQTLRDATAAAGLPRPLPLVNDPRCPRCSLHSVCLPDEVNGLRAAESREGVSRRKVWPSRDDALHLVAQQNGSKIGVNGQTLKITDYNGQTLKQLPLANVETLSLLGSVQISTQALHVLAERGIPIAFLSAAGRPIAVVDPLDSTSADTRRAQVRRFDAPAACLELSRALVAAKIVNQRTLLLRNHADLPKQAAADLAAQIEMTGKAASLESLRGHEGQAAAIYFQHFAGMIKDDLAAEFARHGRQRRPPPDPINSCLSMAYSMLTHECTAALRVASLEPSIGAYHVSRPGRPALALDLMEPFRPLIADSVALSAFNRGELREGHFLRTAAGCVLTDSGRRAFFGVYGRRMDDEVTHPVFGYKLSYRRMLQLHARLIAAWLLGEVPTLAFLTTR